MFERLEEYRNLHIFHNLHPHRLLLKVDGSFLSFETKIDFDKANRFQKEDCHVLKKSRWQDITVKVMVDVG